MSAKSLPPLPEPQLTAVRTVFHAAVATLSTEDQSLEQISRMLPLLERGLLLSEYGYLS